MTLVRPFRLAVSDAELVDLRERLARTRFLDASPRRPDSGMTPAYLRQVVDSWAEWDWRAREQWLAAHPQYIAEVDGASVHFVHLESQNPDAPALLVMHGWPHTFAMQLDFADLLPDFHVVVPSFPGFGFSPPYADRPASEAEFAATMHGLMTDVLGYSSYLSYGEDLSANVSDLLGSQHPGVVAGLVVTHAHFPTRAERAQLDDPEATAFFRRIAAEHELNGAYGVVQETRPDTLAVGLNDSPAGLAAWVIEKLVEWSDTAGPDPAAVESRISRDRLLTEAMIYWTSGSIATSFRPYHEGEGAPIAPVQVPAAVFIQRHERDYPEVLARAFYRDLRSFTRLAAGGHFTVAEVPDVMADHVREFARDIGAL